MSALGAEELITQPDMSPGAARLAGVVLLLLGAGVGAVLIYVAGFTRSPASPSMPPWIPLVLVGGFAVGLCAGGIYFLLRAGRSVETTRLYPGGFVQTQGDRAVPYPWARVRRVWEAVTRHLVNGQHTKTVYAYTVERDDGRKAVVEGGKKVARFGEEVRRQTGGRLLAELRQTLREGREIDLGVVRLTRKGIGLGDEFLPWSLVGEVSVGDGRLYLTAKPPRAAVLDCPASEVANLPEVLWLLEHAAPKG